jgi:hypothetical protein
MTEANVTTGRRSELWGVCAYFNPLGFERRLANYRVFRKHLEIPLVTVEYGFQGRFELADDDAEIVIRCPGDDILWQRERLLNVALAELPDSCEMVARLDGDVVFADPQWHLRARDMLLRYALVQPFSEAYDLPAEANTTPVAYIDKTPSWEGFGAKWQADADSALLDRRVQPRGRRSTCAMGLAWAFRRELHDDLPIYDACVLGGAEHALLCAACSVPEIVIDYQRMGPAWADHYRRWADLFHQRLDGSIGYIDGKIGHLWHGRVENRGYATRYRGFPQFNFDPNEDISLSQNRSWRWSSDKPAMHEYVRKYFVARREDG